MAASGTIKKDFAGGYRVQILWSQDSVSIDNNQSTVTAKVQLVSLGAGYNIISNVTKSGKLTINGVAYPFTFSANLTGNQTKTLYTKTVTVPHGVDGSKTCTFSADCSIQVTLSGTYYGTITASGSGALDTIPRATVPTLSSKSPVLGNTITINTPRASDTFTHTLKYAWGKQTGTIGEGVTTSKSWTVPLDLAVSIPNQLSGTGVIICETYQGTKLIGSQSVSFTASVPASMVPTVSFVGITEAEPGLAEKFGAYVQGHSKLKVAISAAGVRGSTIKGYKTTINGVVYTEGTFTSDTLLNAGETAITTVVTDSRGRTVTITNTVTVLPYTLPTISKCLAYRCNPAGEKDDEGTSLKMEMEFLISDLQSKNDKLYKIEYKEAGATIWSQLTEGSVYAFNDVYVNSEAILNADKPYDIRLTVTDYFGTATYGTDVPTAFTIMDIHSSGRGISFGKVAEEADLFDVALPARFRSHVEIEDTSGIIIDSGWLDLTLKTGWSFQYETDKPQYRKVGKVVYLRGLVDATASAGTTLGELPAGFRPVGQFNRFACALNQKDFANVQVGRNGLITDYTKTTAVARTFLCLNGISFFAD